MSRWRQVGLVFEAIAFLPVCLVLYQLAATMVGRFAEPILAPALRLAIIDHFHVELYLEALFLAACLAFRLPRTVAWGGGALMIPIIPVLWLAVAEIVEPAVFFHRPFAQEASLWAVESFAGGLASCLLYELVRSLPWPGPTPATETSSSTGG